MTISPLCRAIPLLALLPAIVLADDPLTIGFSSSLLSGLGGQTLTFLASIANTSGSTVFLNGDSLNIAAPLMADDTKFFLNFPVALSAGSATPALAIFDVKIPSGAPLQLYSGDFTVLGGSDPNTFNPVGSANFAVNVVPEPRAGALLVACLGALGMITRRCRRA